MAGNITILSHFQANVIRNAHAADCTSVTSSGDLGLSRCTVEITSDGARFPGMWLFPWNWLAHIAAEVRACFRLTPDGPEPIRIYSEEFGRLYSLMPTEKSPALLLSGATMHRFRDTHPQDASSRMVKALGRIRGPLLDTATGLGYTAIEASKNGGPVTTIELDPNVLEIARENPWSKSLFNAPQIQSRIGDSCELIGTFDPNTFSAVVHDPPVITLAGELYSKLFYEAVHAVLVRKGKMFHYIGDPFSGALGVGQEARHSGGHPHRLRGRGRNGRPRPA